MAEFKVKIGKDGENFLDERIEVSVPMEVFED